MKSAKERTTTRLRRKDGADLVPFTCRLKREVVDELVSFATLLGCSQSAAVEHAITIAAKTITEEERAAVSAVIAMRRARGVHP